MNFIQHILAVYAALRFIDVDPVAAVERATWHICLANGFVAFGWGTGHDDRNHVYALFLQSARRRLLREVDRTGTREQYHGLNTLWLHWRLPARAPEVSGMPSANVYGL